jgi:formylglycine-generating enzyme required for sulfatase activity
MTFVQVCGGTFTMGSDKEKDDSAYSNEFPAHAVTLSPFEISTTEVTNGQYQQFQKGSKGEERLPVTRVSWNEAKAFCQNYGYELPTEAEWEYAARGGTTTKWSLGDKEEQLGDYAWLDGNSEGQAHPVGEKLPNPLGLYDMHGNVYEWVEDCYDTNAYENRSSSITNPLVDSGCERRVLRGGSFVYLAGLLRSAFRIGHQPEDRVEDVGFRCVRRPRRQP